MVLENYYLNEWRIIMKRVLLGLAILTSIKSYASIDIKELVEAKESALKQKICHDINGISTDDAFYSKAIQEILATVTEIHRNVSLSSSSEEIRIISESTINLHEHLEAMLSPGHFVDQRFNNKTTTLESLCETLNH